MNYTVKRNSNGVREYDLPCELSNHYLYLIVILGKQNEEVFTVGISVENCKMEYRFLEILVISGVANLPVKRRGQRGINRASKALVRT
jgi:hypothetical protein